MAQKRNVDYQSLVSQADIYYSAPVFENYKGMPVGNGVTGSIVWMGPDRLKFQINRVDVFAANGATTAGEPDMTSPDYLGHQEYCGGCAFLDISFGRDVFTETDTVQHLRMYDAELGLEGRNLQASLRVWAERDVFCLDVKDLSGKPEPVSITLSMLRPAHVVRKNHTADSRVFSREGMAGLTQAFSETCDTGVEGNDHFCASAVLASAKGCTIAETKLDSERCVTLTLLPETSQYSLYIASGASFQSLEQAEKDAQSAMFAAFSAGKEQIENSHRDWWHDYWSRSYIDTSFDRRYSLYWYTYLYFIGSTMRGGYPAKFNGLLFNADGDFRMWGGQYWWYNQSRSHYGLDTANHGDRNAPLFGMLLRAMPKYQKACEQIWGGHGGIILPETEGFSGPEILPDDIAEDLKAVLLDEKPISPRLLAFMENRSGLNSRWAIFAGSEEQKKQDASFRWHSNLCYNAGDTANSMWNHYLYTGDLEFLKKIYPWLKGVAEFYRFYPRKEMGEDGCWHFHHLGWAESITWADDVIDDLVMMRGIYKTVVAASEILGVDADLRDAWDEMYRRLPPYPTSEMEDAVSVHSHPDGFVTYAVCRKPCHLEWIGNTNDCRLRMLHNFDLVNLETKKTDPEGFELANRSYEATEVGRKLMHGKCPDFMGGGFALNFGLVEAARLGRTDIVRTGLPALLTQFTANQYQGANRLAWYASREACSIQELGVYSDGLQEPLLQSIANGAGNMEPVIYVFPAWPMEWDASFELLAKGAFLVHSKVEKGEIPYVRICSQKGGVCRLHNPWPGRAATVSSEQGKVSAAACETITFDTSAGQEYWISPEPEICPAEVAAPCRILLDDFWLQYPYKDGMARIRPGFSSRLRLNREGTVEFRSDREDILRVDGDVITGVQVGETVIRAWIDGAEVASRKIIVCHRVINDHEKCIRYQGKWRKSASTDPGVYFYDCHRSENPGDWLELDFSGYGFGIHGAKDFNASSVELYLDGEKLADVCCKANERLESQLLYSVKSLKPGFHTLRIVNADGKVFALDYFRIFS